jgi:hypothetical protein
VTASTGVEFRHANGAAGQKDFAETPGSGVCLADFDGDGRVDVYLVTCVGPNRLYRNLGGWRFEDVTGRAGCGDEGWGMGAVAADVDGDADLDLFVTNLGSNRLYINRGDGTFRDETAARGVDAPGWNVSAAFLDADRDGDLDLYVARYVKIARPDTMECIGPGGIRLICLPTDYPPAPDIFFRNKGGGAFENATAAAGLEPPPGRGLGVVATDYDGDGWPDLYVANDLDPNFLFHNLGDGTFEEVGFLAGVSHSESGTTESGMGSAAEDYDGDGRVDLFVTNFVDQTNSLYHNAGDGFFQDETAVSRIGRVSIPYVGWGTALVDVDGDGWRDLIVVNGHVEPDAARMGDAIGWKQPGLLLRNAGDGTFEDVTAAVAPALVERHSSRGLATGDLDDDGDPDVVIVDQNGPARFLENRRPAAAWIGVRLAGKAPNTGAGGARVEVHAGGVRQTAEAQAGGSFASGHDRRLLFALGKAAVVDSVVVRWPGGARVTVRQPATNRFHDVKEVR